jgi:endonuclease/exonuclease/phosphatase family metal-dependent hydrolase
MIQRPAPRSRPRTIPSIFSNLPDQLQFQVRNATLNDPMFRAVRILVLSLAVSAGVIASEASVASFRKTVGASITFAPDGTPPVRDSAGRLIVVNWNVHVGNGNVADLIDAISKKETASGRGRPEFVFLLEEAVRQDPNIPASTGIKVPKRIGRPEQSKDVAALARQLGWWLYYAPSMRNGDGLDLRAEDRGNAILSSLPLQSVEAVELPFVVQRRVALIATVADANQQPKLRVAVTHFDTRAPLLRGWIFGGPSARNTQAKGLVSAFGKFQGDRLPLVVGGDFNTFMGSKGVIDTMSQVAPHTNCGSQATHALGTLDHIFADVPAAWSQECRRGDTTFGSDHYPLILSLNVF